MNARTGARIAGPILLVFLLIVAARVLYLFAAYTLAFARVQRFHVESAVLVLVFLGLVLRAVRDRERPAHTAPPPRGTNLTLLLTSLALSLLIYWPAVRIGYLSDDFVLTGRAREWRLGAVSTVFFRPAALSIWSVLLSVGAGPALLHLLNILLHGLNAYLVYRVVGGLVASSSAGLIAGAVFLVAPMGPEAVAWCSGFFDVLATTFVLLLILLGRRYRSRPTTGTRVLFVLLCAAALTTKETGAVAVVFVLFDALVLGFSRPLIVDVCMAALAVAAFSAIRLAQTFGVASPPLSKYLLQRAIFGGFGGVMDPWHIETVRRHPWMPIAMAVALLFLFVNFAGASDTFKRIRHAAVGCAWLMLPLLPVFPIVYVGSDLQQSRYLYMSLIGWSLLVAAMATSGGWKAVRAVAISIFLIVAAAGTRLQLGPWIAAAKERDVVLAAAPDLQHCSTLTFRNLPDNVSGAYVFRNGANEALGGGRGSDDGVSSRTAACTAEWDNERKRFQISDRER